MFTNSTTRKRSHEELIPCKTELKERYPKQSQNWVKIKRSVLVK